MGLVRDLLGLGNDLYWTTGLVVFLGGFVLFCIEAVGQLRSRRKSQPKVVNVEMTQVHSHVDEGSQAFDEPPPVGLKDPGQRHLESTRARELPPGAGS